SDDPITIGRLPENMIQVDNLSVSGNHARIVRENGNIVLYDNNSTNGTYVNGQRVARAVLSDGDTIHVGRHILTLEAAGATPAQATAGGAPPVFTAPVGILSVQSGKTDKQEYLLDQDQVIIGKSDHAAVHLQRWFAPKIAAILHRRDGKFFLAE